MGSIDSARPTAAHHAQQDKAVAQFARLAKVEVYLELPHRILVVKAVHAPPQLSHRIDKLAQPREVVE